MTNPLSDRRLQEITEYLGKFGEVTPEAARQLLAEVERLRKQGPLANLADLAHDLTELVYEQLDQDCEWRTSQDYCEFQVLKVLMAASTPSQTSPAPSCKELK